MASLRHWAAGEKPETPTVNRISSSSMSSRGGRGSSNGGGSSDSGAAATTSNTAYPTIAATAIPHHYHPPYHHNHQNLHALHSLHGLSESRDGAASGRVGWLSLRRQAANMAISADSFMDDSLVQSYPSPIATDVDVNVIDALEDARDGHSTHSVMALPSTSKQADRAVAPFLAKHIPDQYNPQGVPRQMATSNSNTKYCYRHRPDLKCRRQADEPSMDQLQQELETVSQRDRQAISHVWSLFSAAPAKHRNLMLRGILSQCCFPQLSFLSASVRDLIRIDFLTALPVECSFKILCYLDTTSLCKAAQVSQRWRSLADDDVVWHRMCEQHIDRKCDKCGVGLPLMERKRLRASKRQIQLRATGRGLNEWSPKITPVPESAPAHAPVSENTGRALLEVPSESRKRAVSDEPHDLHPSPEKRKRVEDGQRDKTSSQAKFRPWKDVYKDRFKVGSNWKRGRCSVKTFKGHTNGVMCLQFDDSIIATGSYDNTINIWDLESGEILRTLRGHEKGVRALQFDDTKLISGSVDKSLKVWNWRTGECLSTYTGHLEGVICLHFDSKILASGSIDRTIKIWNFEDKSTFLLRGHTDWVNAVRVDSASRTVFSASDDLSIKLWDLDTHKCVRTYKGHVGQVQQVLPLPPEFEFDETNSEVGEDDVASNSDRSREASESAQAESSAHNSSAADDSRRLFEDTFRSALDGVSGSRSLPPQYMLTGALDSTVRLWNVHTGKCVRTFFGHVEGVWGIAADTLRIVSGSEDRTVKIWDGLSGKCESTYGGHSGPVTCVALGDSRMVSGSEDGELRVYCFKDEAADGGGEITGDVMEEVRDSIE